jgi:putative transposase
MPYQFQKNMHLLLREREYILEERLPSGEIRLRDLAFDECRPVQERELVEALFKGELEFLGDTSQTVIQRKMVQSFVEDFKCLKKDDKRKAETYRRYDYVKAIEDANLTRYDERTVKPLLAGIHKDIEDRKAPHWRTVVYAWLQKWITSGRDLRALIPDYTSRGNRTAKITGVRKKKNEVFSDDEMRLAKVSKGIVQEGIAKALAFGAAVRVSTLRNSVEIAITEENQFREEQNRLPQPHRNTIYNTVRNLNEYDRCRLGRGREHADHKFRSVGQGRQFTRVLQREEFDDTTPDLFIVDTNTRLPLGRGTITFGIECYATIPAGFHVGFDGPGYLAIMGCLLHAIQPKTYLKELYPMVEGDWPVYGVLLEIGVDNGPGYISKDLADACLQIGTVVDHCKVGCPDEKAQVERSFGELNEELHRMPGSTFSELFNNRDYEPSRDAVISLDAFLEVIHVLYVDILCRRPNRGRKNTPLKLWNLATKNYPPPLPRRMQDLRVLLGRLEYRKIGPSGIELFCLFYNSTELVAVRREIGGVMAVKYDPIDLGAVYVYNPITDKYLTVPATDQQYAKDFSLWQHDVIRRYVREIMKKDISSESLRRAKKTIQDIVNQEWIRSGRINTRAKLARWMGIRQPDYNSVLELPDRPKPRGRGENAGPVSPLMLASEQPAYAGISDLPDIAKIQDDDPIADYPNASMEVSDATPARMKRPTKKKSSKGKIGGPKEIGDPDDYFITSATKDEFEDELDLTGFEGSLGLPG